MGDRMDEIVAAAVRQGFTARQTKKGTWIFWRGNITLTFRHTPRTSREWLEMIQTLRGAGLVFPPERD